jgi:predicted acylesterase/phospholipase RssA
MATSTDSFELIWVCRKPGLDVPMEALTRLLAAASARQFGGLTAIIIVQSDGTMPHVLWNNGQFVDPGSGMVTPDPLASFPTTSFWRIFVVNPGSPNDLPTGWTSQGYLFNRIVYVTDALPTAVPSGPATHLKSGTVSPTDRSQTYFSSFIPSILLGTPPPAQPRSDLPPLGPLLKAIVLDGFALVPASIRTLLGVPPAHDGFHSEPLEDDFEMTGGGITASPRSPIKRDACRIRFDLTVITGLWNGAQAAGTVPTFDHTVFQAQSAYRLTAFRWARAVTNRRIGLAVSGGGATSYRLIPVVEKLDRRKVPIDVVGGMSGGASFCAYYARDGMAGLGQYENAGNLLSIAGVLFAGVTSQPIESGMDWLFQGTTLQDLEVRFVPVTTALPPSGRPVGHAVVRGTLGAAVRASGALPVFFARTVKHGVVYTDGSMTAQIPARALPDYGADYVFACNSIPGPDRRNLLSDWPGGEILYRFTFVGPMLDLFASNAFLLHQIGRDAGLWAHQFIDATPVNGSVLEIFEWWRAAALVKEARNDPLLRHGVALCAKIWKHVRKDPT